MSITQAWEYLKTYLSYTLTVVGLLVLSCVFMNYSCVQIATHQMAPRIEGDSIVIVHKREQAPPDVAPQDIIVYEKDNKTWISRVIGKPGDRVKIESGQVWINDQALAEPYASVGEEPIPNSPTLVVPRDYFFVMDDNRKGYYGGTAGFRPYDLIPFYAVLGKVHK